MDCRCSLFVALSEYVGSLAARGTANEKFAHTALQTTPKLVKKARGSLDVAYSHLGGKAFGRDKKGRVTKDDSSTSADMQAASHMGDGGDYSAYVCYEFEVQ